MLNQLSVADSDFDAKVFVPKEYNSTYYDDVMEDERALIAWQAGPLHERIIQHLASGGRTTFPQHFDAGSGPAVHHLLALEKYSDQIVVADYLPENLAEIRGWVDGSDTHAHDWNLFTSAVLAAEGLAVTPDAIVQRENSVRSKIADYRPLDLRQPAPAMRQYRAPLVTSFFVADSATNDKRVFSSMTRRALSIVSPGGLFVGAYLGGCNSYAVGDNWLRSAAVTRADIEVALVAGGAHSIDIRRYDTPQMRPEGFDHIFAVSAEAA